MTDNEGDFYEGYIVCPACGYRDPDSFMVWDDVEECACKQCGAMMSVEVERITYYRATFKLEGAE